MSAAATERVGRYQLLEPVGHGPSGTVSRAKVFGVAGFERQFAIKRFHPEVTATAMLAQALSVAARAYGSLEHPRIARMSEFGVAQGTTFTAVEFVVGLDAMRLIAEARLGGAAISAGGALALVSQAARAVGYAHGRGLTHLGLAPTNVMITVEGDIKLTDFGILSASLPQRPTDTPRLTHRIAYLAPEQLANEATSAATDVFALGVLAFELISGQRTFRGESPQQIAQSVMAGAPGELPLPRPILRVLQRCLARSPFERFPDARALADALDAALRVAPIPGTRKDIGALVKQTMERIAALNEGELSGVLALDLGTGPVQPPRAHSQTVPREFQDLPEPETHQFSRPESIASAPPGVAARLAAARSSVESPASTVPDLPKPATTTMAGLAPPPIPVPPGITGPPSSPPPPGVGTSTLLGFASNKPASARPIAPIPELPSSTLARAPGPPRYTRPASSVPPPVPPIPPVHPSNTSAPPSFPGPLGTPARPPTAVTPRPGAIPPEVPPGIARPAGPGILPSSLFASPPSNVPMTAPGILPPSRPASDVERAPPVPPRPPSAQRPASAPARPATPPALSSATVLGIAPAELDAPLPRAETDLAIAFDDVHDDEGEHHETLLQLASASEPDRTAAASEREHDVAGPNTPIPNFAPMPALDMRRAPPPPPEPMAFAGEPAATLIGLDDSEASRPALPAGPAFDDTAAPISAGSPVAPTAFDDTASSPYEPRHAYDPADDTASQLGSTIPEGTAAQLGSAFPEPSPHAHPGFAPPPYAPAEPPYVPPDLPAAPFARFSSIANAQPRRSRAGLVFGVLAAGGLAVGGWFAYGEYMAREERERVAAAGSTSTGSASTGAASPGSASPGSAADSVPAKPDAAIAQAGSSAGSGSASTAGAGSGSSTGAGSSAGSGSGAAALDALSIVSKPPGARVFLDGADVGKTPLELEGSPDRHTIALLLADHELVVAQIDGHRQFSFDLKPITRPTRGQAGIKVIQCKNPERYYVYVDGKPSGMTCPTERIFTTLGRHTVEVYDLITEKRTKWDIDVKDTRLSHRVRIE